MSLPTFAVLAPPVVDREENVRLRAWYVPAAIANMVAYAISPDGIEYNLTGKLRLVTTPTFSFVELFIDFNALGDHTIYLRDTVTGDYGVVQVRAVQWATNMDVAVSTLRKQSTETSRLRNDIRKQTFKPV